MSIRLGVSKWGRETVLVAELIKALKSLKIQGIGDHTHLSNIDCLMARAAHLVCFISTVNGCSKNTKENALEDAALGSGTQQNLSNLYSLDICVGNYRDNWP